MGAGELPARLADDIREQVTELRMDPSWYRYRTRTEFAQASMSTDGTVQALMNVEATISAKQMMPCAILDVPFGTVRQQDVFADRTQQQVRRSGAHQ